MALGSGLVTVVGLYLLGTLGQKLYDFPAPIAMLILVVALKLLRMIPADIERAGKDLYAFTAKVVTYPLLFAMGVALTPGTSSSARSRFLPWLPCSPPWPR